MARMATDTPTGVAKRGNWMQASALKAAKRGNSMEARVVWSDERNERDARLP